MDRLVASIRQAFELLNQRLMSRDQEVRTAIDYIAGQFEHRDQQFAQINRKMDEDRARNTSWYTEVQQWKVQVQKNLEHIGQRMSKMEEDPIK